MERKIESTVFVYRHKRTGKIQAHYIDVAGLIKDDPEWEHLATIEPRAWIECHYKDVEQRDDLLAALDALALKADELCRWDRRFDDVLDAADRAIARARGQQ